MSANGIVALKKQLCWRNEKIMNAFWLKVCLLLGLCLDLFREMEKKKKKKKKKDLKHHLLGCICCKLKVKIVSPL